MELVGNQYKIQGVDLLDIANEYGTPLYVYDASKIMDQYHKLTHAFEGLNLKVKFACKSCTNINVIKLLKSQGAELDVVSIQEARIGILAGYAPSQIMFTPNCVDFEEIQQAVELGVMINIDSLPLLEKFGQVYGSSVPCCIRVTPNISAGGNLKIMVGHNRSKFGIPLDFADRAIAIADKYSLDVVGLHKHSGSDIKEVDAFMKGANVLFKLAESFPNLKFLDFGSGFKVPYTDEDEVTDLKELGSRMKEEFTAFCERYGRELEIWFEPGKFLVSEAGVFLAKVNVVKETPDVVFAGLNSGLNHLIRPMMYEAYHDIINISNPTGEMKEYDVVGYICETDTFGEARQLSEVEEGHVLAIKNAGAYGITMSSNYNSRLRPAEVMILNGEAKLIRKREEFDDLLKNQIDVFAQMPLVNMD